jgi:hypothetical protein
MSFEKDDELSVEIRFPKAYVDYNMASIRRFSAGISHLCKGAALLGEDETEFLVFGMTIMQVITIEEAMKNFGIEMAHDSGKLEDGQRWTYFYADLKGLKEKMKGGEFDEKE